jgi:hypothetical protein
MRKLILCICIIAVVLVGCINQPEGEHASSNDMMNTEVFLELLKDNGFALDEIRKSNSFFDEIFSGTETFISPYIYVIEFLSIENMMYESIFVSSNGFSINGLHAGTSIQWLNQPYWLRQDLIIVLYVGTDERVINFLMENLELFAGP